MLDVHAPHQSAHTWKDFFIHIATIVIGLLIAVGLEQTIEHFHHDHQVAQVRESLDVERRFNSNRFGILTDEFHRFVPKLETNLAIFTFLRGHPNAPSAEWPGELDWLAMNPGFLEYPERLRAGSGSGVPTPEEGGCATCKDQGLTGAGQGPKRYAPGILGLELYYHLMI